MPLTAPTASLRRLAPRRQPLLDSLVALDAKTGKRVWHFQMVHHDLWEYDNVGPATLADLTVDGRRIKAVIQPNKNASSTCFDRATGKPVWPIDERPVPQSTVPGEQTSPTQPFPTKPPAFDRQGFTEDDLIDFTPELRARRRDRQALRARPDVHAADRCRATSRRQAGHVDVPGAWGAANWHTGAFDPETGMLLRRLAHARRRQSA